MDHRDVATAYRAPYRVDEAAREIVLLSVDEEELRLPLEWEVCPTCDGNGSHVNPSIDAHGLTAEDFDDPDFAEMYRSGIYDQPCSECGGRRVVPTSNDPRFAEACDEAWRYAREDVRARELGY